MRVSVVDFETVPTSTSVTASWCCVSELVVAVVYFRLYSSV